MSANCALSPGSVALQPMVKVIKGKLVLGRGGALVLLVLLGGINRMVSREQYEKPRWASITPTDEKIMQMQQGDLALRRGRDMTSYMISSLNERDKRWSHCGLVQIEEGYPFVYHYIGSETNKTQGLRRDSARVFFSSEYNNTAGLIHYQLSESEKKRQSELIQEYYKSNKTFDERFDLGTDDKLYCAEFVYRLMNDVKQDSGFITPVNRNGYSYLPVDRLYSSKDSLIWQMSFK